MFNIGLQRIVLKTSKKYHILNIILIFIFLCPELTY